MLIAHQQTSSGTKNWVVEGVLQQDVTQWIVHLGELGHQIGLHQLNYFWIRMLRISSKPESELSLDTNLLDQLHNTLSK